MRNKNRQHLTKQEMDVLRQFAKRLRDEFRATDVRVFGSAARGGMDSESDIDVFVVLPKLDWETEKRVYDLSFEASLDADRLIAPVVVSSQEMSLPHVQVSPFIRSVDQEGQTI
jgi:predicted nucleotidyltransferase